MPRGRKPKVMPEDLPAEPTENVVSSEQPPIDTPIQKMKKERRPRVAKEKVIEVAVIKPQVDEPPQEDIDAKILRLISQQMATIKPSRQEPDDIIVVKKKVKRAPPRKKTIYIEEDDSIDDVVKNNHPDIMPSVTYW